MISWIQRYFQKHFRLVFIVVLIAVALPMVVIYSSSGGGHSEGIRQMERPFFNVNLDNPETARRIGQDAELSAFLRFGFPAQGAQLQQYALQRVAGLALADELHLPTPTPDQVAKYVPTLRAFQNQEGQFDHATYTRFSDSLKTGGLATPGDVNRVLRDDLRLTELIKLAGGPGYLQPSDVATQLNRIDSVWTVQIATLDYKNFNPTINPSEADLAKFHTDNAFRYDVAARPKLSAVVFKAADFMPPVAPTEAELRAFYNANAANFPVPGEEGKKDEANPAVPVDNFPKVRTQVETAIRTAASRRLASEAANRLTMALYEKRDTVKANSPQLLELLAAGKVNAVDLPDFPLNQPPAGYEYLASNAATLSRLNKDRFVSDALPTPEGFVVLFWKESLPGYSPMLAQVRERVLADYRDGEKRRLFNERGNTLKTQLQSAALTPTGFADKAAAEKLEVKTYSNFTLRELPQDFPRNAAQSLLALEKGKVSAMIATEDKGQLVYAQEKKAPDLTTANPRYAEVKQQLSTMLGDETGKSLLVELTNDELERHAPAERR